MLRRVLRIVGATLALLLVIALAGGVWLRSQLRASLPPLDGEVAAAGLSLPVEIERDDLGVATVRAASPVDLAYGIGFAHGQDRFFQMDLTRRSAAGELAEVFGAMAVTRDRDVRVHRFRHVAEQVLAQADPAERTALESYAQGVNAGLASLGARPFEYLALRAEPAPWRPEDTALVLLAMFIDLQDERAVYDATRGLLYDVLPGPLARFLVPMGSRWDAPLDGSEIAAAPVPGPEVMDLRHAAQGPRASDHAAARAVPGRTSRDPADAEVGSNNWAVAGAHTPHGGATLANDMHLGLRVPNVWYRARFEWTETPGAEPMHHVTGATLPGAPVMIVGSNGHVAWGYTNSYGDWFDLVELEVDPDDARRYRTADGWEPFVEHSERIAVKGGDDVELTVRATRWGPVLGADHRGRLRALRWVAHDPEAVDLILLRMHRIETLQGALDLAQRCGVPALNVLVAHRDGGVGWTVMGRVPRRYGFDGSVPTSWADGTRGWDGWLDSAALPRVVNPSDGRLWTANARPVGAEGLRRLGDGGYALGARAQQIRDGLRTTATDERSLMKLQLDDRALFLERWQRLLLDLLSPDVLEGHPLRRDVREYVEDWGGRAAVESVGYRLVRGFRGQVSDAVLAALTAPCASADETFDIGDLRRWEVPVWAVVSQRPAHLLPSPYDSWNAFLLDALDGWVDELLAHGGALADHPWGERNTTRIQHPLSLAVPALSRWLDMPAESLPGDSYMPRVQHPASGASQRMVVSPGREEHGLFHMPGGQSGHPWSPYYRAGHSDWSEGRPTPLLPGPAKHTLRLVPSTPN